MNKMKKVWSLMLSLALSATAFTACTLGTSSDSGSTDDSMPEHEHSYTELKQDDDGHWYECECGEEQTAEAHDYSVLQSDENNHWYKCATCAATDGEEAHVAGTEVKFDATNHWNECECGYKMNVTEHTLIGGKDETYHWGECECGYEAAQIEHEYTVAKYDETHHWNECSCGAIEEKVEHDYATAKYDEVNHWNECSCGEKSSEAAHDYTIEKSDEANHWNECSCGAKSGEETHDFGDVWSHDADKHWKECECGKKIEEVHAKAYTYALVENTYQAQYACCGEQVDNVQTIAYFDRENKSILQADGTVKTNVNNYWDGATNIVEVAVQEDGSVKLSFDPSKFTEEQKAAAGSSLWVAYAIPVDSLDLNYVRVSFQYKAENMNPNLTVYGAKNAEAGVEDYVYETGEFTSVIGSQQKDLGEGWYQYTFIITGTTVGTTDADYIVLSLDNCGSGNNQEAASTAYISNVTLEKISYCTITLDGEATKAVKGDTVTLSAPEKFGYKFLGWVDGNGKAVENSFEVSEDVALTSTWARAAKIGKTDVDLTDTLEAGETYLPVVFEGIAGEYVLTATGIKAVAFADGELGEPLNKFTLTEDGSLTFAVVMGDDYSVFGSFEIEFIYDPQINENAVKVANAMFREGRSANDNIAVGDATGIVAPNGFKTVSCVVSNENNFGTKNTMLPHGFDDTSLAKYGEVWFAVKVVNGYVDMPNNQGSTENVWVYFHLTQTDTSVWKIEATANGQTINVMENQSGTEIDVNDVIQPANALATILYGKARNSTDGGYVMIRPSVENGAIVSVYSTEVMGLEKPKEAYNPNVSASAAQALTSAFLDCSVTDVATNDVDAPVGFNSVTKYVPTSTWVSSYAMSAVAYNDADLTVYDELWFAVKTVNAAIRIWPNGSAGMEATPNGEWVYFHLTQNDNATWTIKMTWQGTEQMEARTLENQTGTTIKSIIYDAGSGTATDGYSVWVRANDANATGVEIYSTEVMGTKKTSGETPDEEKPGNPDVSASAEKALSSAFLDCSVTDVAANDVDAPVGFNSVAKYVPTSTWVGSYMMSSVAYNDADLTAYGELWFAVKTVNAAIRIWPNGSAGMEATPAGEWVYFHLTQNENGTWTIEMTWQGVAQTETRTLENQTGTTIKSIIYDVGSLTTATDGYSVWVRANDANATGVELYSTEVLGVKKVAK